MTSPCAAKCISTKISLSLSVVHFLAHHSPLTTHDMLRIAAFRVASRVPRSAVRNSVRTFTGYNGPVAGLTPQQEEVSFCRVPLPPVISTSIEQHCLRGTMPSSSRDGPHAI